MRSYGIGLVAVSLLASVAFAHSSTQADQTNPTGQAAKAGQTAKASKQKGSKDGSAPDASARPVLWSMPADIAAMDTLDGPGGGVDLPKGAVQFLAEDMNGSNPKFDVQAADGTKWKVKLGGEAEPETAADHLMWAVGFYVTEDYFVRDLQVEGLPEHLHRGQNLVGPGGEVHNVRLKRMDGKHLGAWQWKNNPFVGTREFNGLRAMMCLINNWDLKDENNAIYEIKGDPTLDVYLVTDLGSSFGTSNQSWKTSISKGNEKNYAKSNFITKITPQTVSFKTPTLPPFPMMVWFLGEAHERVEMQWVKRDLPRSDVVWLGGLLAQLSPQQIGDVFTSAGFTPGQVAGYTAVMQSRIHALNHLEEVAVASADH